MPENDTPRNIETQIELDASIEDVWKALTDGEGLANWFPIEARVTPGVGGAIWVSWGESMEYTSPIDAWEENKHLRTVWMPATPPDQVEQAKQEHRFIPFDVAVDYHLESKGGRTILRLVHSGFSRDSSWDNQYDGTVRGWEFELRGLKHYLEHHNGVKRTVVHAKHVINEGTTLEEAWSRLMSADGLGAGGALDGLGAGDRYTLTAAGGDELAGEVHIFDPPRDFCGTDEKHNHGLLRMRCDEACFTQGQSEVNLWLSTYGLSKDVTSGIQSRWQEMLNELLGTPIATK